MATSLSVFGSNAASGTLSTANTLLTTLGGSPSSTGVKTTFGTHTGYGEISSQTSTTWAAAGSLPAQDGHGWLLDATTLEGQSLIAGNWTPSIQLSITANTITADIICRASVYHSGGTYTSIGTVTLTAQTINTVATIFTLPSTSLSAAAFATGDKLYIDWFLNITTGQAGGGTQVQATVYTGTSGNTKNEVGTPGYVQTYPPLALADPALTLTDSFAVQGDLSPAADTLTLTDSLALATVALLALSDPSLPLTDALTVVGALGIADPALNPQEAFAVQGQLAPPPDALTLDDSQSSVQSTNQLNIGGPPLVLSDSLVWQSQTTFPTDALTLSELLALEGMFLYPVTLGYQTAVTATLPTASSLTTTIGNSPPNTNIASTVGLATGWGELTGAGITSWPALATIGAPTGAGFLWDVTTLEGAYLLSGNWTITFRIGGSSLFNVVCTLVARAWIYNPTSNTYTPLGSATLTGVSITSGFVEHTFPITSMAGDYGLVGDKIYVDLWADVTTNNDSTGTDQARLADLGTTITAPSRSTIVTAGVVGAPVVDTLAPQEALAIAGSLALVDPALTLQDSIALGTITVLALDDSANALTLQDSITFTAQNITALALVDPALTLQDSIALAGPLPLADPALVLSDSISWGSFPTVTQPLRFRNGQQALRMRGGTLTVSPS